MEPAKKRFKPQDLRTLLGLLLVIVLGGGAALFYIGLQQVKDYSVTVNQRLAEADTISTQASEAQALQAQLAESNTLITKAGQIFASRTNARTQLSNDVKKYAQHAGLSIDSISFDAPASSTTATVQLSNPVTYTQLITFLNNLEGNLPKLQTRALSVSRSNASNGMVNVDNLKIEISAR